MSQSRNGNISNSTISGAPREKTFPISYYCEAENRRYEGTFTAKRPTVMQAMQIEGIKSSMLNGKYFDPRNPGCGISFEMDAMAEMLAFLKVVIVNTDADWWMDGEGEFSDPAVVYEIYLEAQHVDPFRQRITPNRPEDTSANAGAGVGSNRQAGGEELNQAKSDGGLAEMV